MKLLCAFLAAVMAFPAMAQVPAPQADPLAPLLLGTWSAKPAAAGYAAADSSGNYTFHIDLNGHAIERTSSDDYHSYLEWSGTKQ